MNTIEALRLIALKGAIKPDLESNTRFVLRWYSKTFNTPLPDVYNIPVEDVWLAYFEERYHGMEPEELEHEVEMALEDPDARKEREMADEVEKASELDFAKMAENMANMAKAVEKVKDMATLAVPAPASIAPEAPLPLEPDIEMEFITPEDMEKLLDGGMATETKPPKPKVDPMSFK